MKVKSIYFVLLAAFLVFSACTEDPGLEPLLSENADQINLNGQEGEASGGHWENTLECAYIKEGIMKILIPGSCTWEPIWVELDANLGGGGGPSKKYKGNKPLTKCVYFGSAGYNCTEMFSFQNDLIFNMNNVEWGIFLDMTVAQRSKYVINARIAIDKANQYFPGWERNGKGDALRQAIASALNAKDLGVNLTKSLQDASEIRSATVSYMAKELQMKRTNEAFGRNLIQPFGPTLSASTLCNMVIYARANGGLVYITNLSRSHRPTGTSAVVSTSDPQSPPNNDCPPGSGDESGPGIPVGVC